MSTAGAVAVCAGRRQKRKGQKISKRRMRFREEVMHSWLIEEGGYSEAQAQRAIKRRNSVPGTVSVCGAGGTESDGDDSDSRGRTRGRTTGIEKKSEKKREREKKTRHNSMPPPQPPHARTETASGTSTVTSGISVRRAVVRALALVQCLLLLIYAELAACRLRQPKQIST